MFRQLTETDGVAGYEQPVSSLIQERIQRSADTVETDNMGNLICFKAGTTGEKTVIVTAPMDEPGLIVTQITEDGYLRFAPVGKLEPKHLVSKRIQVNGHSGVISFKAIHLTTKEERKQPVKIKDLLIDIGADTREAAAKLAIPGDYCAFDSEYVEFGKGRIKAKSAGTRAACWILTELFTENYGANLIAVFTVQSQIGGRGSEIAAYKVVHNYKRADYALSLGAVAEKQSAPVLGGGPVLALTTKAGVLDHSLKSSLVNAAKKAEAKLQFTTKLERNLPDFNCPGASLSIPCRYPDTAWSVLEKQDIDAAKNLIKQWIEGR